MFVVDYCFEALTMIEAAEEDLEVQFFADN